MKGYVLHGISNIQYENVEEPKLDDDSVLVEVMAAGVCGSDIPRIFETGTYHFPTIPGHEFSGIVRKTGDSKNNNWLGKRVGIFPLIPCKTCIHCKNQDYEMCQNYSYLGSRTDGGFAEYVRVPVWNLLSLPDEISYEEAAMLEPFSVAIHSMKQIEERNCRTIAIYGAGPIGMMVALVARAKGIEHIYIIVNKQEQAELAHSLGFNNICNIKEMDPVQWILQYTEQVGVDTVVEGVGSDKVLGSCLSMVKGKGSVLLLANPKGDYALDKGTYWKILRKQLALYGTWNSSYGCADDNWHQAIQYLVNKQINIKPLITHKLAFNDLIRGLTIMRDKTEFYSKIMIVKRGIANE
ncbi:galactitol-1-phosphate 5-dehydrogenase [Anaerosporobacter faecicola]|uniref:galactitol-1-phosphate 5-dehydrogenase n=1 Tax=Anaerosporobacter faecicola TaxID=2718714 RepID=UPI001439D1F9|nr:galactitol-1-phosphate 5-dehydrogenase [Anaerosporobacter faecicola]